MATFQHQIDKNSHVTVDLLHKMDNPTYCTGEPILPGDQVLCGTERVTDELTQDIQLEMVKFKESHIGTVLELEDDRQYIPVIKWINNK